MNREVKKKKKKKAKKKKKKNLIKCKLKIGELLKKKVTKVNIKIFKKKLFF